MTATHRYNQESCSLAPRWLPPDAPRCVVCCRLGDQFPPGSVVVHRGKHYQASEAGCMANHLHTGPRTPEPPEGPVSTPLWLVYAAFSGEAMEPRMSPFLMVLQGVQVSQSAPCVRRAGRNGHAGREGREGAHGLTRSCGCGAERGPAGAGVPDDDIHAGE